MINLSVNESSYMGYKYCTFIVSVSLYPIYHCVKQRQQFSSELEVSEENSTATLKDIWILWVIAPTSFIGLYKLPTSELVTEGMVSSEEPSQVCYLFI